MLDTYDDDREPPPALTEQAVYEAVEKGTRDALNAHFEDKTKAWAKANFDAAHYLWSIDKSLSLIGPTLLVIAGCAIALTVKVFFFP